MGTGPCAKGRSSEHCTADPAHARIAPCFSSSSPICARRVCRSTPREYLDLMRALEGDLARMSVDEFYRLARALLVKDERNLDKFDVVFAATFKGVLTLAAAVEAKELPEEWLRRMAEKYLSPEERAEIEKLGFDKLMETLRQRLAEQKGRHQGGSKWIGTGGTSPFGAYGDHPEGVRIGQDKGRRGSAVKVWDRREFKDFDGDAELGPRNIKLALRRLGDSRARARPRSSISTARSARPPTKAISTSAAARAAQRRQGAAVSRCRRLDGLARRGGRAACSPPPRANSSGSSISTSTIASTRACGRTTAAAMTSACRRAISSTLPPRLSRRLRRRRLDEPARNHGPGGSVEHLNPEPGRRFGSSARFSPGRARSGSIRRRRATGIIRCRRR
jgi:hypothetical protein